MEPGSVPSLGYAVKTECNVPDRISVITSFEAIGESASFAPGTITQTRFPSLTGLRRRAAVGEQDFAIADSRLKIDDLDASISSVRASPLAALQAAWAIILSTYTDTQDVVTFGTTFHASVNDDNGRSTQDSLCAVPTQVRLGLHDQDVTTAQTLRQLTRSNEEIFHQYSFSREVQRYFPYQNATIVTLSHQSPSEDLQRSSEVIDCPTKDELAVRLEAWPNEAGTLTLKLSFTDSSLNQDSARLVLTQLGWVLRNLVINAGLSFPSSVIDIPTSLLSVTEQDTESLATACSSSLLLHSQFEAMVETVPERVALIFRENLKVDDSPTNIAWTYRELNHKADHFARSLNNQFGSLADRIVPICMERCPQLYVAILGTLKAGGAWCPIDPFFPHRRRRDLIARTGAEMLIIAEPNSPRDPDGIPSGVIAIDVMRPVSSTNQPVDCIQLTSSNLAYLIWTSGTTGEPKGVPIHHGAAVTSMMALQEKIPHDVIGDNVRCLQFSQFTFDVFVQDLFYTWGIGGTLISSSREVMLGSFPELATATKATHAHLTPAFAASVSRKRCPTLEVITMIGEKLPQNVADEWAHGLRSFNTYGPAETTVVSTLRQFGFVGDEYLSSNVGLSLPSVSTFVMRNRQPILKNGIGELALGGPQLSKGYWQDQARSSGKFVWNEQLSRHLYMTGDVVRQLYDNSLEFVGRTDDLVKVQGIRIELSEIAFSLRSCHPLVEQIEVDFLSRDDRPSNVIVAFLAVPSLNAACEITAEMGKEAVEISKSALLEARQALPGYMVPSVFLVLQRIPRTSSGKTDRKALKDLYHSVDLGLWAQRLVSEQSHSIEIASWSPQESAILECVTRVSGTSQGSMSRASNLPSVGVDSIGAMRLVGLLGEKKIYVSMASILHSHSLGDLLEKCLGSPTLPTTNVFDLAAFHERWRGRLHSVVDHRFVLVAPTLPLQESLIGESMQNAQNYWSNLFFSLDAHVALDHWYNSWRQAALHIEALRTAFVPVAEIWESSDDDDMQSDMTYLQLVYEEAIMDWVHIESSEDTWRSQARERALAIAQRHQKNHFRDPPWAVTVLGGPKPPVLMLSIHHCIRDDVSLSLIEALVHQFCLKMCTGRSGWKEIDSTEHCPQLQDALRATLPNLSEIELDEHYWAQTLLPFQDSDIVNSWPDLSDSKAPRDNNTSGSVSHTQDYTTTYRDLQAGAMSIGAPSVASVLRVAVGCALLEYLETEKTVFAETWSARAEFPSLAQVVGPLMKVLPFPFRAQGTVRETLAGHSDLQRDGRAHGSIRSRKVRKYLDRPDHEALYPAVFNFLPDLEDDDPSEHREPRLWKRLEDHIGLTVEHPLAFNFAVTATGLLRLEVVASETIMDTMHLGILARQIEALFTNMLQYPDLSLQQITSRIPPSLLSMSITKVSEAVDGAFNNDPTQWVDHYANLHPEWPAVQVVSYLSETDMRFDLWNFAELSEASKRVATLIHRLRCYGRMMAVCIDRRLEAYATIAGILKSGNTYLPIDEDLPAERKSFLLVDSRAAVLFSTGPLVETFQNIPDHCLIVRVDESGYGIKRGQEIVMDNNDPLNKDSTTIQKPHATENAYLLYTSGSTGTPKGVIVSRGNLSSFIEAASHFTCSHVRGMDELAGNGRYLGLASRAFDVHLVEMFLAWRHGMATVTASRAILLDNLELALRKLCISHAYFVPSLLDHAGLNSAALPDLRYLSVGGEKISRRVIDTWAADPNVVLVNAYGPTEMTIGCAFKAVTPATNVRNVGPPLGKTTAHVLVPGTERYTMRGVAGELCLTGDLVANGYHNRPDAEGFVANFNGTRMYRTGDRVRMMSDDSLEFLGRSDDQTKIRGQRLELGEVSEVIRASATATFKREIVEVSTIVAQHPSLTRPQIVGFLVPSRDELINSYEASSGGSNDDANVRENVRIIKACCRDVLPSYMVPDHIVFLKCLPTAPSSGKANKKELLALFSELSLSELIPPNSSDAPGGYIASGRKLNKSEESIRDAISKTLRIAAPDISHDTDIFQLGFDSLSAISLTVRLRKLGINCNIRDVLRGPTVESLASLPCNERLETNHKERLANADRMLSHLEARWFRLESQGMEPSSISAVAPCLPLQESLVAASLNNDSAALYINHIYLKLVDDVNHDTLHNAWAGVVADHSMFRTCFQEFEGKIVQISRKWNGSQSMDWNRSRSQDLYRGLFDLRHQEDNVASEMISNMSYKPPIRFHLMSTFPNSRGDILAISIHHSLYDRTSLAMTFEEVYQRYHSRKLPQPRTPFKALIQYVLSQDTQGSCEYWKAYLAGYKPPPTTFRKGISLDEKARKNISMSATRIFSHRVSGLEELSKSLGGTVSSIMQGVFGIVLAQSLGSKDVVFGAILSGRTLPIEGADTILAPCFTTIPQRVIIQEDDSNLQETLASAQDGFAKSLEYQHTALRDVHRWLKTEKPIIDALFSYVRKEKVGSYSDLWSELESVMPNEFPLCIEIEADHGADQIQANCTFSPDFGDLNKAQSFLGRIDDLLGMLIRHENVTVDHPNTVISNALSSDTSPPISDDSTWSQEESEIKIVIANICEIDSNSISKRVSFFSLGIDSIIAIRFARCLREKGMDCSSADAMRYPSIAALSDHLTVIRHRTACTDGHKNNREDQSLASWLPNIPVLGPDDAITDIFNCTPLQSSMLTQTLASNGDLYVNHHAVRLFKGIEIDRLRRSWDALIQRTEILRTTFHFAQPGGIWLAAVHQKSNTGRIEYDEVQLVSHKLDRMNQASQRLKFREAADFTTPPWDLALETGHTNPILTLSMHHSLYDGRTVNLLFHDLAVIYQEKDPSPRPPFSTAAREIDRNKVDAKNFWLRTLAEYGGIEPIRVPYCRTNGSVEVRHLFKMELKSALAACRNLDVTLQTVALLAVTKSLSSLLGRRDICFGHVVGGRSLAMHDADEVVGPLFNTVPFRLNLKDLKTSNKQAANEIQRITGDSQPHQHASLRQIQQAWRKGISDVKRQLFDTLFVFDKTAGSPFSFESGLWQPLKPSGSVSSADTEYPINIEFEQTDQTLILRAAIHEGLMTQQQLSSWLVDFESIFEDILDQPSQSATECPETLRNISLTARNGHIQPDCDFEAGPGPDLDCIRATLSEISRIPSATITLHTNIFSLGLDSIAAIQIAAICRKNGHIVTVADVLQGQTLGAILRLVRERSIVQDSHIHHSEVTIDPAIRSEALTLAHARDEDVEEVYPCLGGQVYHLAHWLKSGRLLGEPIFTYSCQERLDAKKLKLAWRRLRELHPILRTNFVATESMQVIQIVLKSSVTDDFSFQSRDSPGDLAKLAVESNTAIAHERFDLFTPPARLILHRGGDLDCVLLKLHHATYDAWTIPTLIRDLTTLYRGVNVESGPTFKSFIQHTLHSLSGTKPEEYWISSLKDCQPTLLMSSASCTRVESSNHPKPVFTSLKGAILDLRNITARLQKSRLALPTLILIAFARILARHTSISNPVFGLYQIGRSASFEGIHDLCAPCLNVTPLLVPEPLSNNPHGVAQALQSDLAARVPFEQSKLYDILEWVGSANTPLFNTFANILWHEGSNLNSTPSDDLLVPWRLGSMSELAPTEPMPGRTAVDMMDEGMTAEQNLYLDVERDLDEDALNFAIRCDGGLMGDEEVGRFAREIAEEILVLVEMIGDDVGGRSRGKYLLRTDFHW